MKNTIIEEVDEIKTLDAQLTSAATAAKKANHYNQEFLCSP